MDAPLMTLNWSDEGGRTCRVVSIKTVGQLITPTDVGITVTSYSVVIQHNVCTQPVHTVSWGLGFPVHLASCCFQRSRTRST